MRRPPRDLDEPLLGGRSLLLGLVQGLAVLVAAVSLFGWALAAHGEPVARALAFATMVLGNLGLILLNRAGTRSLLATLRLPNRPQLWVNGGAVGFLALALGVHEVRDLFGFATPHPELLALSVAGALLSLGVANVARHLLAPAAGRRG
jgi:Ca2+-transporting ATPase